MVVLYNYILICILNIPMLAYANTIYNVDYSHYEVNYNHNL